MAPLQIAIVGVGKIALDQHVPALAADPRFRLAATASRHGRIDGVPAYPDIAALLAAEPGLDAVSLCTPPVARHAIAAAAIEAGLHVMLEKPPAATILEVEDLARLAEVRSVTLFASWHSREAAGVARARDWLRHRRIRAARILWKEDIRQWHPGQHWILAAGGMGVFDPGINALSILSTILPEPLFVTEAALQIPEGREGPIAACISMQSGTAKVVAEFDFRKTGEQQWDIEIDTDDGVLLLRDGGATLDVKGAATGGENREYPGLYARFADLIVAGKSDVDSTPLKLVADAFLLGTRSVTDPIDF